MTRLGAGALAALLAASGAAPAQVYVGVPDDPAQPIVLSNFRSEATPALLLGTEPPAAPPPVISVHASEDLSALIERVARQQRVPARLLHAVIAAESAYDPSAVSPKGARGLMQLMPETAARFQVQRPFDPSENVQAGARYLRWLTDRFAGRIELVLAAYNAGEGSVVRAGYRVPDYPETRQYVRKVLRQLQCSAPAACAVPPPAPPAAAPDAAAGLPAAKAVEPAIEGVTFLPA